MLAGTILSLLLGSTEGAAAQAPDPALPPCPEGRISHIFVDNHSIFDLAGMDPDASFRWAYRIANALHMRTRQSFLEEELLFAEGDCYNPLLAAESERILRGYAFIARADVYAVEQPDGTRHVVVDTQDEWTTKVDVGVGFDDGIELHGFEVTEESLLGRGVLAGFLYRERRERQDLGVLFETPRVLGTRWDASLSSGRTRVGSFFTQGLFYPFLGEIGRFAARERYARRESLFSYAVGDGSGDALANVLLPRSDEEAEVAVAMRLGRPGNLTVFGAAVTRHLLRHSGYPGNVEIVERGDFSDPVPADSATAALLAPQVGALSATRIHFLLGQRNLHFTQRRGLDALRGVQDVRLGSEVTITLGRSLGLLRGGVEEPTDDLHTRTRIFFGTATGPVVTTTNLSVEGRQVFAGGPSGDGWRDVMAELDWYTYVQTRRSTWLARLSGAGGWSMDVPFQLTLGGRNGVRGYHQEAFPGGRRIVLSAENRMPFDWPAPGLFDFGASFFADAGAMWAGSVPFGVDSGWRASLGAGLRVGFPAGTAGVVRLDAAVPVRRDLAFGDLIVRISLTEVLGLLAGFEDPQLERSRRGGVGADLFSAPR